MIVDINRCNSCYSCVVACKDEFVGNPYPPYSYPQNDRGHQWIKLLEIEKGKFPYVKVYPIPLLCMHCDKPPCIDACAIVDCIYKTGSGVVVIDPAKCNGCKSCIDACPYGAISFNDDNNICQKCTLCIHRLEQGKEPACVDACPSGVFFFSEESEVAEEVKKRGAKEMYPEHGTKPRVSYMGLPSVSLAGHVIDSQSLMDVPNADITVTDTKSGLSTSCQSNVAGNFLTDAKMDMDTTYSVKIEYQGYLPKTLHDVTIDIEYKHLGDVKIFKAS
ncbi:4Fe-4S dicluster domain-containing protein [Chloroflexota bacterium]